MKKTKIKLTNLIILDASGSMSSKIEEVKGGMKELLSQIKRDAIKDARKVQTTTIVTDFSSHGDFRVLTQTEDSQDLSVTMGNKYSTRAMTALYDAIKKSFDLVPPKQDSVFVTIFTDGAENDSKEMDHSEIKKLIAQKRKEKWVITFMGTSEADVQNAVSIGISIGNTMTFSNDSAGVADSFNSLRVARSAYYMSNTTDSKVDTNNLLNNLKNDE